jgi:hypothetical protein
MRRVCLALSLALFGALATGVSAAPAHDEIIHVDGLLVVDGRAMQLFTGSPKGSRRYAEVLNEYAETLRGKVNLYSIIVPTAQTFYLPDSYDDRVRHEPPNISATYELLDASITTVDAVGALRGHASEYLYFRTDHHWTALAAYYTYTAFATAAGLTPLALDPTAHKTISPFRGSLYEYTRESNAGHQSDSIEYWTPSAQVSVQRWGEGAKRPTASKLLHESIHGYGVFLGGDHPLMVVHGSQGAGRRALLIKNSYGNPFAVYLVEHFETVVIVDYRKYEGKVVDLVEEHQITDVIVFNGAITANATSHISSLSSILD